MRALIECPRSVRLETCPPNLETQAVLSASKPPPLNRVVILVAASLMLYALLIAWGLVGQFIGLERAYLLLALPCLVPVVWYAYGFWMVQDERQDWGLLMSAAGWALMGVGFLLKQAAMDEAIRAAPPDLQVGGAENTAAHLICFALAVLALLAGGLISWRNARSG